MVRILSDGLILSVSEVQKELSDLSFHLLAKKYKKPMTAGSDSHSPFELGRARTWLQGIETADDIYEELSKGRTQITGYCSFPLVHIPSSIWERLRKIAYDKW